jgi:hypothetical protein
MIQQVCEEEEGMINKVLVEGAGYKQGARHW